MVYFYSSVLCRNVNMAGIDPPPMNWSAADLPLVQVEFEIIWHYFRRTPCTYRHFRYGRRFSLTGMLYRVVIGNQMVFIHYVLTFLHKINIFYNGDIDESHNKKYISTNLSLGVYA